MALTHTPPAELGLICPDFSLIGTDDKMHQRRDFENGRGLLVMFICNHCPYVKAIEERLINIGRLFQPRGVNMVAISSNDVTKYPDDSLEKMKLKNYPFAYLLDESQDVARAFDAVCTPDFFLFDESLKLVYRGRLDDNWKDANLVTTQELAGAMDALLNGLAIAPVQKPSMGCNIKWKAPSPL